MAGSVDFNSRQILFRALPPDLQKGISASPSLYQLFQKSVLAPDPISMDQYEMVLLCKAIACLSESLETGGALKGSGLISLFVQAALQDPSVYTGLPNKERADILHLEELSNEEWIAIISFASPFLGGIADKQEHVRCLRIISQMSPRQRQEVMELSLPFMENVVPEPDLMGTGINQDRVLAGMKWVIFRTIATISPLEREQFVELATVVLRNGSYFKEFLAIFDLLGQIPSNERSQIVDLAAFLIGMQKQLTAPTDTSFDYAGMGIGTLQNICCASAIDRRRAVLTLELILPLICINGCITDDAQLCLDIFDTVTALIEGIQESEREQEVASVMPILLSIPNILAFASLGYDEIHLLRRQVGVLIQYGYSKEQSRDVIYCMAQARLAKRGYAAIRPSIAMLDTCVFVLHSLPELQTVKDFVKVIIRKGRRVLWDRENELLVQTTLHVFRCTQTLDAPWNPYMLYERLRTQAPLNYTAKVSEVGSARVRWNYPGLQEKAAQKKIKKPPLLARDLPAGNAREIFADFMRHLKQQDPVLLQNELEAMGLSLHAIDIFKEDPYIQSLMIAYSSSDTVIPANVLKWRLFLEYWASCDESAGLDLFSEKASALLQAIASIGGCDAGKRDGIDVYYRDFYCKLDREDPAIQAVLAGTLPREVYVRDRLQKEYQNAVGGSFLQHNSLMRALTGSAPGKEVNQLTHQSVYIKNLFGDFLGLFDHSVDFEINTHWIFRELLARSPEEVFGIVEGHLTPLWFVQLVQAEINQRMPRNPILFHGIKEFIGYSDACWDGDGYDAPMSLSEAGACQLLIKLGYFIES